MSILYVCHGHPRYAKGGGELAAWRLFKVFEAEGAALLAAAPSLETLPPGCEVMSVGQRQWLIKPSLSPLQHGTEVNLQVGGALHQALAGLQPEIVHLHHYVHVGIDLIHALKRWFPQAGFLFTFHEYWAPCAFEGRLLRRSGVLCDGPDAEACAECVGQDHRADLVIRNLRLQRMLACIDHFLSPSLFLKQRHVAWGMDPHRISVVENLPAERPPSLSPPATDVHKELVLGFFGQINPWKGVDLIIEAVAMARVHCPQLRLEIHGCSWADLADNRFAQQELAARLKGLLKPMAAGAVQLCGRYEPCQLSARMSGVDLVVMGSTWYENAPMVIQEAFLHGRPVLAPRLGGMAEKVKQEQSGLLFEPGNAVDLARLLRRCCQEPDLVPQLQRQVERMTLSGERVLDQHRALYQAFKAEPQPVAEIPTVDEGLLEDLRCNFEPLGANCELGFLMGRLGIDRSSLFRWLFTPLAGLELVLSDKLQNFFSDPQAVTDPVMASDMVVDRRTGIFFHAGELRQALEQAAEEGIALEQIHDSDVFRDQLGKYRYLVEKFLSSVSNPATLHVFSDFHGELTEAAILRVNKSLRDLGKPQGSTLLFVKTWDGIGEVNSVRSLGDGIQVASIRRFAPGEHADRIDQNAWMEILMRTRNYL
ncbi:glycosyl transferases group 1 family protein [Synechococcus sp. WH 8103]|nr:glycosyl transferases group 1 family protein [Synechococcus sp. WH 8103]